MLKILDASPGYGAPLSEEETKDFLTTRILNIHLGTVDEKGHANIYPTHGIIMIFKGKDQCHDRKTV